MIAIMAENLRAKVGLVPMAKNKTIQQQHGAYL